MVKLFRERVAGDGLTHHYEYDYDAEATRNAALGMAVCDVIYSPGTGRLFTHDKAAGVRRMAEALERAGYLPAAQVLYAIHDVLKKERDGTVL